MLFFARNIRNSKIYESGQAWDGIGLKKLCGIYIRGKKLLNDPEYFLRLGLDLSRSNIHYHAKIGRTGIPVFFWLP